jgi:hypothetical protein
VQVLGGKAKRIPPSAIGYGLTYIFLVPKLCLGTPFITAKLSLALIFVHKYNLGTS